MRFAVRMFCFIALLVTLTFAQTNTPVQMDAPKDAQPTAQVKIQEEAAPQIVTVPSGTKVLLMLKNTVSSRNARPGDGIFLETSFPVVEDGRVLIPAGTYVQGVVDSVKRSGRVKGRAELLLHFTTLIYPNGYTVTMPGSLESSDSADTQKVKDKEGTVQADGTKGRDAGAIATSSADWRPVARSKGRGGGRSYRSGSRRGYGYVHPWRRSPLGVRFFRGDALAATVGPRPEPH